MASDDFDFEDKPASTEVVKADQVFEADQDQFFEADQEEDKSATEITKTCMTR